MNLKDKLFSFEGRLRRRDYWLISLVMGVSVFLVSDVLRLILFGPAYSIFTAGFGSFGAWAQEPGIAWLAEGASLATLWPSFALSAKRAHDRGRSARLVIGLLLLAMVYSAITTLAPPTWFASPLTMTIAYGAAGLVMMAAMIYLLVVVGFLDGTPGPNRFGPSPKGVDGDTAEVFS
jgi:uncharacterized membrane protein YhaH (DUF805 family)